MATYTSAASGLWSAGATWVGGVKPPSAAGHKIVIAAGHVVEYDEAAGTYGDDTSSTTAANNAIVVNGTLKFSRSTSTRLTCRGSLVVAANGTYDMGRSSDRIPAGITAEVRINDSAALAIGKHALASRNTESGQSWYIRGSARTRNTTLAAGIAAGATSITVAASSEWAIGDELVIASATDTASGAQVLTITGGSSPTWTVSPVTVARSVGCSVGNLTSNVKFSSMNASFPGPMFMGCSPTGALAAFDVGDFLAKDIGAASGWTGISSAPSHNAVGLGAGNSSIVVSLENVAFYFTGATVQAMLATENLSKQAVQVSGCAFYSTNASVVAVFAAANSIVDLSSSVIYRSFISFQSANSSGGVPLRVNDCRSWSSNTCVNYGAGAINVTGGEHRSGAGIVSANTGQGSFMGAYLSSLRLVASSAVNAVGTASISNCTFSAGTLTGSNSTGSIPSQAFACTMSAVNGVASDNRVESYWQRTATDSTTRRRSAYSAAIIPLVANTDILYRFVLPAVAGVAQVLKGSLRFDSTYGTGNPPSITLSGQGVSQTFTAAGVADAWNDFTFSFTPTGTGNIDAVVTVRSTVTTGKAWLDGIYHFPMTQSVRHFGYEWLPQAAQIVDTRITLTEAAALALPVAVNHGTSTITVTGAVTARGLFEACIADLVQSANQGQAVHIDSATGATFETTYTVVLSGAGAVDGVYTDATGVHVTISVPGLSADTRVYLRNMTDGVDLDNVKLTGTGYTLPVTWTADKTIRLRAGYAEGAVAKLPIEATGVLTSAGLTFIVTQEDDTVYNELAIDGGTITEFTPDYPNVQIDISDPDGETSVQRLYVWAAWTQTSALGIVSMFRAMSASDTANFLIDQDVVDAKLDNVSATPVRIIGGYLSRKDGSTLIVPSSNSIQIDPGKAYLATGGSLASVIEGGLSGQDILRVILAAVSGRTSGVGTEEENYLSLDGSKARITSTFDERGNRLTVDIDGAA